MRELCESYSTAKQLHYYKQPVHYVISSWGLRNVHIFENYMVYSMI